MRDCQHKQGSLLSDREDKGSVHPISVPEFTKTEAVVVVVSLTCVHTECPTPVVIDVASTADRGRCPPTDLDSVGVNRVGIAVPLLVLVWMLMVLLLLLR